ncbi:MAG: histidinol-phosphate transaminase [Pseudomonadota bacterium]
MVREKLKPTPKDGVMDIAAYVPGKHSAPGVDRVFKLSANETPLGPSAHALEAFSGIGARLEVYPDGNSNVLREAIADVHGLNAANIICGNGSDDVLALLGQAYLSPGDEGIVSAHGFLLYKILISAAGAKPVSVPETDCTADVDAILAAVTQRTRMVFIANPNNPTGTYIPVSELRRLHAGLPGNVVLVIDAAYAEYVQRNDYESGIELVSENENVVMTRTFSKIYGLAALRIGWLYGPAAIVDALNRIRGPFNVNAAAIAAGAAAVRDRAHVADAVEYNRIWLPRLTEGFEALGLTVTPSAGNFVLVHFDAAGGKSAAEADAFLCSRGYILRQVTAYGFPNALRMSVGTREANEGVLTAMKAFMETE